MHVAKQSAQGSIVLLAGNLTATVGQTVASILIARLLGPESYGIYSLALVVPSFFTLLVSLGVNTSVTRFVAYHVSRNENAEAVRFAESAVLLTLISGIILSCACYVMAPILSDHLFQRPYVAQYLQLASAIVFGQALLGTAISAAIGWNAMGQASLASIAQSLIKVLISPLLIASGFGIGGAIAGQTSSAVLGAAIAVGILYWSKIKSVRVRLRILASDAKQMISYGLPAFIANIMLGIWPYYLSVVLAAIATDAVIGYYQAASNFTVAISLLSGAAGAALFPAFTSLHGQEGDLPTALRLAVKYVAYITVPAIFVLAATAKQLLILFYGSSFAASASFLIIFSISALPVLIGLTVLPAFFNGIGKTRLTLVMTGTGAVALFVFAPILAVTLNLGVNGLIYSLVISNVISGAIGLYLLRSALSAQIDTRAAISTLAAGVFSFGVSYAIPDFGSSILTLIIKLASFSVAYLTIAPLLRAVRYEDLEILGVALGEMPFLKKPIRMLLAYEKLFASRKPESAGGND